MKYRYALYCYYTERVDDKVIKLRFDSWEVTIDRMIKSLKTKSEIEKAIEQYEQIERVRIITTELVDIE